MAPGAAEEMKDSDDEVDTNQRAFAVKLCMGPAFGGIDSYVEVEENAG